MIKSMTGFGRGVYQDDKRTITTEIRSVNHRYQEISVKLPRKFSFAEEEIKKLVKEACSRGKIEVFINVAETSGDNNDVQLNMSLAKNYYERIKEVAAEFPDLQDSMTARCLATLPEVMTLAPSEENEEEVIAMLSAATNEALKNFVEMRKTEGQKLIDDILYREDIIFRTVSEIEGYAPKVEKIYAEKFAERIKDLLGDNVEIPEDRILLEAAIFADKANITEEIVRLKSHCNQLKEFAKADEPIGKKMDFLVQEMNRESNTIGSKANDAEITKNMLVLKAEIEKIREQVQNIE